LDTRSDSDQRPGIFFGCWEHRLLAEQHSRTDIERLFGTVKPLFDGDDHLRVELRHSWRNQQGRKTKRTARLLKMIDRADGARPGRCSGRCGLCLDGALHAPRSPTALRLRLQNRSVIWAKGSACFERGEYHWHMSGLGMLCANPQRRIWVGTGSNASGRSQQRIRMRKPCTGTRACRMHASPSLTTPAQVRPSTRHSGVRQHFVIAPENDGRVCYGSNSIGFVDVRESGRQAVSRQARPFRSDDELPQIKTKDVVEDA